MNGDGSLVELLVCRDSRLSGKTGADRFTLAFLSDGPVVAGVKVRASRSRRASIERLGGGGEGGFEPNSRGDFGAASPCVGVSGRLDTVLDGFGEPPRGYEAAAEGSKKGDWSPDTVRPPRSWSGDCGGWTVTGGGARTAAVSSAGFVCCGGRLAVWRCFGLIGGFSLGMEGFVGVTGDAAATSAGLNVRRWSGLGAGDRADELEGGGWFMLSNRARRDETGFYSFFDKYM